MKRIIIGIHGLGNKPPASLYQSWWRKSLYEGFTRIGHPRRRLPFELVYWADILHPVPLDPYIKDPDDKRFLDEPYLIATGASAVKQSLMRKKLLHLFDKQLDRLKLDGEGHIIWKHITDLIIQRYFFELDSYYRNSWASPAEGPQPVRDRIRSRLAEVLRRHQDKEILLIAHSMGAIIAYDVLAHTVPEVRVQQLVTIGAPLGVPVVVEKIRNEWGLSAGLPPTPDAVVERWHNLADLEDKVAFDYELADDYRPNRHQVAPVDVQVVNDYIIQRKRNPHKDFGYLRTRELATICFNFISQGSTAVRIRRLDLQYRLWEKWLRWVKGSPQSS